MLKRTGAGRAGFALIACFCAMVFAQPAGAASNTVASRAPICMTVSDSFIIVFLIKVPAWQFTNHCSYVESFYAQYPGSLLWTVSAKFNPGASVLMASNGEAAKLIHILECPSGSTASGNNQNVCTK